MSFPTYINFQVNNTGGGRINMVVHSHAVELMSRTFRDFYLLFQGKWNNFFENQLNNTLVSSF